MGPVAAQAAVDEMPLVQLAAVHAAVAESFELSEALAAEGLSPSLWQSAELSWKSRLASDPACMEEYRGELAAHQDRLGRAVEPIDADVQQWALFLRCYQLADDPAALLEERGMGLNDLARLQRIWSRRMAEDGDVEKKAAKASRKLDDRLRKGEQLQPPHVTVGPARLVPSPAARSAPSSVGEAPPADRQGAEGAVEPSSAELLTLDQYAALRAALEHEPERRGELLREHGVTEAQAEHALASWAVRITRDPQLRADYRALRAHTLRRLELDRHEDGTRAPWAHVDRRVVESPGTPMRATSAPATPTPVLTPRGRGPFAAVGPLVAAAGAQGVRNEATKGHAGRAPTSGAALQPDETAELSGVVPIASPLPFRGHGTGKGPRDPGASRSEGPVRHGSSPAREMAVAAAAAGPARAAPSDPMGGTLEVPVGRLRQATMPFRRTTDPSAPPAAGRVLGRGPEAPAGSASRAGPSASPESGSRPADRSAPHPSPRAAPSQPPPKAPDPLAGTIELTRSDVFGAALPFSASASTKEAAPRADPAGVSKTLGAGARGSRARGTAGTGEESRQASGLASGQASGSVPPRGAAGSPDATAELVAPAAVGQALPFRRAQEPGSAGAPAASPRPGGASAESPLPITSIEQLASLHAELTTHPDRSEEVRRRYHLRDAATSQSVERHWRAHFHAHPADHARYRQLLAQYVDWLRRSRTR